jgi:hypothetical protein
MKSSFNTAASDDDALNEFNQMTDDYIRLKGVSSASRKSLVARRSTLVGPDVFEPEEDLSIAGDVYNIFFFSEIGGHGFFFTMYIFALKLLLYSFLLVDTMRKFYALEKVPVDVRITQFLMLPVCVAMQEDLMSTFFTLSNVNYCSSIMVISKDATKTKFFIANILRGIDGLYSLSVNFAVLLIADAVLPLFLHFAAFIFVQHIDNLALDMAESGYLSRQLERVAYHVKRATLPRSHDEAFSALGAALFMSCLAILLIIWTMVVVVSS